MAEDKKTFLLYTEIKATVETLQDDEAGLLFKNILRFVTGEQIDETNRFTNIAFGLIKEQLIRSMENYDKTLKKKSEGGRKGNLKRWHPDLHKKVEDGELTIDEAEAIAEKRKKSDTEVNRSDSERHQSDAIGQVAYPHPIPNPIPNPNPLPIKVDSSVEVSKTSTPKQTKKTIEERKQIFYDKVAEFKNDYSKEMLRNFFEYWTEHGDDDHKMRFEKEKTFGISLRLKKWNKNDKTFNNGKANNNLSANEKHELAKAGLAERDEKRFNMFSE